MMMHLAIAAMIGLGGIGGGGEPLPYAEFPYVDAEVISSSEANSPDGTIWATVISGPKIHITMGQAIPVNGTPVRGPAYYDPGRCTTVGSFGGTEPYSVCHVSTQLVDNERVEWRFTFHNGRVNQDCTVEHWMIEGTSTTVDCVDR